MIGRLEAPQKGPPQAKRCQTFFCAAVEFFLSVSTEFTCSTTFSGLHNASGIKLVTEFDSDKETDRQRLI